MGLVEMRLMVGGRASQSQRLSLSVSIKKKVTIHIVFSSLKLCNLLIINNIYIIYNKNEEFGGTFYFNGSSEK